MSTFITILWGFFVICVVWAVVCLATVASLKEINPASWHYKLQDDVFGSVPNDSCHYWTQLLFSPFLFLSLRFFICIVLLGELIRVVVVFIIFGATPDTKEHLYDSKLHKTVNYWDSIRRYKDVKISPDEFELIKRVPVSPVLLVLAFVVVWLAYEFPWSSFKYAPTITKIEIPWVTLLSIAGIVAVLAIIIKKRKHLGKMIALARSNLCWKIPMKKVAEEENQETVVE